MNVGGCLLLITIVAWSCVLVTTEHSQPKERDILPLLGYLQGYKIGQNFALQLPPFVFSPILMLPPANHEQSVNVESTEDNLDETVGAVQIISPAKLVQDHNETQQREFNVEFENFVTTESDLIEKESGSEEDTFRQNVIGIDNATTTAENKQENTTITPTTEIESTTETDLNVTTISQGPYPTAIYKNELVNIITFTEAPVETMIVLPSVHNKWQNFKRNKIREENASDETLEARSDAWGNSLRYRQPDIYRKNQYSPLYNDIDTSHISNSYGPSNNRWHTYSSPGKYGITSQFRPLAGLYYDGFLHQSPVKKTGFVPYNNNYYY